MVSRSSYLDKSVKSLNKLYCSSNLLVIILGIFLAILLICLLVSFTGNNNKLEYFTSSSNRKGVVNCYLFYTDKCPHSRLFLNNEWKKLKNNYSNKVVFNQIDCYDNNTKNICKNFGVKTVPTIYIFNDNDAIDTRNKFNGTRTYENVEKFINQYISKNNNLERFNNTNTNTTRMNNNNNTRMNNTNTNTNTRMNNNSSNLLDNIDFYKLEDFSKKEYTYCIRYKDRQKPDICQTINENTMVGAKGWQGAYSVINAFIREHSSNKQEMDELAYKIRNKISEWGLCDKDLLQNFQNKLQLMEGQENDVSINLAIQKACGFI